MSLASGEMSAADVAVLTGNCGCHGNNNNCNDGMWGGNWASWIILFLIFGMFGWGGIGGFGGFGGGFGVNGVAANGALTRGELCQDMNFQDVKNAVMANGDNMQAGFRNIDNAICQLGYNNAQLANGIQMQIGSEFRGVDNAVCQLGYNTQQGFNTIGQAISNQGYETRLATQATQAQLADCCCNLKGEIKDNTIQGIMNTNAIQQSINSCCCENEKIAMQNRFDNAQNNCATLQAIDKVGDRIIDYMASQNAQNLRDENFALKLAASQAQQNNYIVNQLRQPCPIPAYTVPNPNCCYNACGCNG